MSKLGRGYPACSSSWILMLFGDQQTIQWCRIKRKREVLTEIERRHYPMIYIPWWCECSREWAVWDLGIIASLLAASLQTLQTKKRPRSEIPNSRYSGKAGARTEGKATDSCPKHVSPPSCILVICYLVGTAIDNVRSQYRVP